MRKKKRFRISLTFSFLLFITSLFLYALFAQKTGKELQTRTQPATVTLVTAGRMVIENKNIYDHSQLRLSAESDGARVPAFTGSPFLAILAGAANFAIQDLQSLVFLLKITLLPACIIFLSWLLAFRVKYIGSKGSWSGFFLVTGLSVLSVPLLKPFHAELVSGQITIFFLLLLSVVMLFLTGKKGEVSAAILGLVSSANIVSGLYSVYYLIYGFRRSFFLFTGSFLFFSLLPLLVVDYTIYREYLENVVFPLAGRMQLPQMRPQFSTEVNQSLNGILSGLFLQGITGGVIDIRPVVNSPALFQIISLLVTNSLFFFTAWIIYKSRPFIEKRNYLRVLAFSLFISLVPLISPVAYSADMVILLIPFSILLNEVVRKKDIVSAIFLAIYVLLNYIEPEFIYDGLVKIVSLGYLKLIANLVLYRGNLRLVKKYSC